MPDLLDIAGGVAVMVLIANTVAMFVWDWLHKR